MGIDQRLLVIKEIDRFDLGPSSPKGFRHLRGAANIVGETIYALGPAWKQSKAANLVATTKYALAAERRGKKEKKSRRFLVILYGPLDFGVLSRGKITAKSARGVGFTRCRNFEV